MTTGDEIDALARAARLTMRVLPFSTTETILLCAIFPFAQRIFSIVRRRDIRAARFLKKFEVFRQLGLAVSVERMEGKGH